MTRQTTEVEAQGRKILRAFARWTPALLLIAATAWLYASGMATDISLDNLQAHEIGLRAEVTANPLLALAVFTALYAVATAAFVPVGLVNVAAGCARAPFRAYVAATVVGAIPYSLIYSYLGDGLGEAFLTSRTPTAAILLTPDIAGPLAALMVISLLAARFGRRERHGRIA